MKPGLFVINEIRKDKILEETEGVGFVTTLRLARSASGLPCKRRRHLPCGSVFF